MIYEFCAAATESCFGKSLRESTNIVKPKDEKKKGDLADEAAKQIAQIVLNNVMHWANKFPSTVYGRQLADYSRRELNMRMTNSGGRNFVAAGRKYRNGTKLDMLVPVKGFTSVTKMNEKEEIHLEKIPDAGKSKILKELPKRSFESCTFICL